MINMIKKLKTAAVLYQEHGISSILQVLRSKYRIPIPQSARSLRKEGIRSEVRYWDDYFRTKGRQWADTADCYAVRFDASLPLQSRPDALLPRLLPEVNILDVGAGPLTYLGKKGNGKNITITAVDPLADEYDRILDKYQIQPLVRTQGLAAEDLTKEFPSDSFDLVFARNCIDHACNPERAILEMIDVVKGGSYILLEHGLNEAEDQNYQGLHQWNFSVSDNGDFLIRSKKIKEVNMTRKYATICTITCEIVNEGTDKKLVTRILKG